MKFSLYFLILANINTRIRFPHTLHYLKSTVCDLFIVSMSLKIIKFCVFASDENNFRLCLVFFQLMSVAALWVLEGCADSNAERSVKIM